MPKPKNRRTKRSRRRRPNRNPERPSSGIERPFPARKSITVITTSDGSLQAAAASFVVAETRLADPTAAGLSGGSGAFTTASVGISDMTAYALARVKSAMIEVSGSSLESGAVLAINLIFSDTQPSTVITTYALAKAAQIGYLHTPVRKIGINSGNSNFRFAPITVSARRVIGDVIPTTDRDFVTQVNPSHSAPVQEWWAALLVTSVSGATDITNGLDISFTLTQRVEAFSRLIGT
jgi:hypothetical protein